MVDEDREADEPVENPEFVAWRSWVSRTWTSPPKKLITTKEAQDRWNKCKVCPCNKKFSWDSTDESDQISRKTFMLKRGIDTPEFLGFCCLHNCDLSVFTFIEAADQFSSKKGKEPEGCWVKQ